MNICRLRRFSIYSLVGIRILGSIRLYGGVLFWSRQIQYPS